MTEPDISLTLTSAIQASFLQPTGPSRTGIDWAITASEGAQETKVIVRTYLDDIPHTNTDELAEAALGYLELRLQEGWNLAEYRGTPGELTVPPPKNI